MLLENGGNVNGGGGWSGIPSAVAVTAAGVAVITIGCHRQRRTRPNNHHPHDPTITAEDTTQSSSMRSFVYQSGRCRAAIGSWLICFDE